MSRDRSHLSIPERFRGPARSSNGGWAAGSLAAEVVGAGDPTTIEVTLRRPPPLETVLTVLTIEHDEPGGPAAVLALRGDPVAEAREVLDTLTPVDPVRAETAVAAMAAYPGLGSHPFPGCFACGPDRPEGDGLRIFPGAVALDTMASGWVPHASLAEPGAVPAGGPDVERVGLPTTWAALDCVGGWADDLAGRPMVLGRMTARVMTLPVVGEQHVVVGRRMRRDGRKSFTASSLYDAAGHLVGTAEHVWLTVDPGAFN